ncbi:MAG: hypothetical protein KC464_30980, partial [Myxococcales bacterium]|nr:hypothetical protein [Myxococcales bacterium]
MTPIPGGFPAAERTPNAGQLRISQTGLAAVTADPAALVAGLLGGALTFDVPADCSGTPTVCCQNGQPVSPCGPIEIDLAAQPGDAPRMEIVPVQGQSKLNLTIRARVRTQMPVPVGISSDCGMVIDTEPGANHDIKMDVPITLAQDPDAGTTRVEVGDVVMTQLDNQDISLDGDFVCLLAGLGIGLFRDTLVSTFESAIHDAIANQVCKACPSGDVAECGPFAAACTDNVCMRADDTCLQELGITGRMAGSALFASLSPGTTGSMDLYEVTGGYATTDSNGVAMGMLGGMLPAGTPHDRCGPPATAPAPVTIPPSAFFQGNTRPDTGDPFDIALGVHQSQLDDFAYAAYDGGILCLTLGTRTVALLNTDTIGLVAPSLGDMVERTAPVAMGLRPQRPPVIVLGANTFRDDNGTRVVDEPLLDITFEAMELDFFAAIEDQYIRLFTVVADVHLPIGMEVGADGLTPVLGDLDGAFSNISVKNTDAVLESPEDLAAVFPTLLELALPQLAGSLGSFALPSLGGLQIDVTSITAVDSNSYLAIFGDLSVAAAAPAPLSSQVDTQVELTALAEPDDDVFTEPAAWTPAARPRAELALGGSEPDLEWQLRVDGGLWS